jgi:hypothetical protein
LLSACAADDVESGIATDGEDAFRRSRTERFGIASAWARCQPASHAFACGRTDTDHTGDQHAGGRVRAGGRARRRAGDANA